MAADAGVDTGERRLEAYRNRRSLPQRRKPAATINIRRASPAICIATLLAIRSETVHVVSFAIHRSRNQAGRNGRLPDHTPHLDRTPMGSRPSLTPRTPLKTRKRRSRAFSLVMSGGVFRLSVTP
jgi:hypothetical protein